MIEDKPSWKLLAEREIFPDWMEQWGTAGVERLEPWVVQEYLRCLRLMRKWREYEELSWPMEPDPMDGEDWPLCRANRKDGKPCRARSTNGSGYCPVHYHQAKQSKLNP